jgi:hypothetical protein
MSCEIQYSNKVGDFHELDTIIFSQIFFKALATCMQVLQVKKYIYLVLDQMRDW